MKRKRFKVLSIFGTRPEAIKLAPVIRRLQADPRRFDTVVAVTAQHREMLDQVLRLMGIRPQIDLDLMRAEQSLPTLTAAALAGCGRALAATKPDLVLVQGDTSSTLAGALAAFYQGVAVGHVEAGLRTYRMDNPFPEEANRRMVSLLATWHFAATPWAAKNLASEGVPSSRVFVTGNPVVDALHSVQGRERWAARELVVVTAHRRENFGRPLAEICRAVLELARLHPRQEFVFPVHRNPNVRRTVRAVLRRPPANLKLVPPQPYADFIRLLAQARLVLTDSGGIQEEAPVFGVPALVVRRVTERPEALQAGARLLPLDREAIVKAAAAELRRPLASRRRTTACPFGDGRAAERIVAAIEWIGGWRKQPPPPFRPPRMKNISVGHGI
ncbi:MAG: UDP-N-acetylglucosamine 2-epimerase (non-hydrolyzing) [candidate division FCPU426 bacterium]